MRQVFHDELEQVAADLVELAHLVAGAIRQSTAALLDADVQVADAVIAADQEIDRRRNELDQRSIDLLARQAPVASDLRTVVASMRISGDLERMGDLARHVAQVVRLRYPENAIPDEVRESFASMGRAAEEIVARAADTIRTQDAYGARAIEQIDDRLDELHRDMFTQLAEGTWQHGTTRAVDAALLSRYYERFGDHAVTIARRVGFLVTGEFHPSDDALDVDDGV
ncbi:phosphate signaling complex protein PhoU [Janibacter terrae]|uniref:Phosphate-specific transport system accessory protein PhoU n=1 Tax=Janibacter terrae TaxID=103817 RepID=A0ABZ2FHW0_9MICO|nr:phosphate signaling complex protein PhoU [Janibacter terrae]MBA4085018.1 phosphate transport system regulatory protein PhoU [Kytococcus sp.]HBO54840.1 phosphate transport system regulatory protein PhoU [Janibacter terrae]HCE60647.1 phosphate transport system regulatory protein PhoU [Janibacter terrae]